MRSELDAIISIRQPFDTRSIEAAKQEAQRYNAAIESNVRLHNKCVELQALVDNLEKRLQAEKELYSRDSISHTKSIQAMVAQIAGLTFALNNVPLGDIFHIANYAKERMEPNTSAVHVLEWHAESTEHLRKEEENDAY